MVFIVMGVSGVGKTTIGKLLAERFQSEFFEGDDYHSAASVAKMKRGQPLTDEDRLPWLNRLRGLLLQLEHEGRNAVLTCSALKGSYRELLTEGLGSVRFVYLRDTYDRILKRLQSRQNHFMLSDLLRSQFDTLEEPKDALTVDVSGTPEGVAERILDSVGRETS